MLRSSQNFHYNANADDSKKNATKPDFGETKQKNQQNQTFVVQNQTSAINEIIQDALLIHKNNINESVAGLRSTLFQATEVFDNILKRIPADNYMERASAYDALRRLYTAAAVVTESYAKNYEALRKQELEAGEINNY